jgi:hypothetical protein
MADPMGVLMAFLTVVLSGSSMVDRTEYTTAVELDLTKVQ